MVREQWKDTGWEWKRGGREIIEVSGESRGKVGRKKEVGEDKISYILYRVDWHWVVQCTAYAVYSILCKFMTLMEIKHLWISIMNIKMSASCRWYFIILQSVSLSGYFVLKPKTIGNHQLQRQQLQLVDCVLSQCFDSCVCVRVVVSVCLLGLPLQVKTTHLARKVRIVFETVELDISGIYFLIIVTWQSSVSWTMTCWRVRKERICFQGIFWWSGCRDEMSE